MEAQNNDGFVSFCPHSFWCSIFSWTITEYSNSPEPLQSKLTSKATLAVGRYSPVCTQRWVYGLCCSFVCEHVSRKSCARRLCLHGLRAERSIVCSACQCRSTARRWSGRWRSWGTTLSFIAFENVPEYEIIFLDNRVCFYIFVGQLSRFCLLLSFTVICDIDWSHSQQNS